MERQRDRQVRGAIYKISAFSALTVLFSPAMAFATTQDTSLSVASYTAVAIICVLSVGLLLMLGLKLAHGLGVIDDRHQFHLRQRLRVLFGATLMLAAVSPYVALNFSMTILIPFLATAGLIVMTWAWGAAKVEVLELDVD